MHEVVAAGLDRVDLRLVDVEAEDRQAALVQRMREGEADISEADDADLRLAALDAGEEVRRGLVHGFSHLMSFSGAYCRTLSAA